MAESTMEEVLNVEGELQPCGICGRTFLAEPLKKHMRVCERNATRKRRVFDSLKQRVEGTELAPFHQRSYLKKHTTQTSPEANRQSSKWREKHLELVNAIRAAKGLPEKMPASPKRSSSNVPSTSGERCPSCDRQFGPRAYDRHVEWCKEHKARIQRSPAEVLLAKERLEARTKYRVPLPNKSKRALIRDKYSPTGLASRTDSVNSLKTTSTLSLDRSPSIRKPKSTHNLKRVSEEIQDDGDIIVEVPKRSVMESNLKHSTKQKCVPKEPKGIPIIEPKSPPSTRITKLRLKINTMDVNSTVEGMTVSPMSTKQLDNEPKRMVTWKDTVCSSSRTNCSGSVKKPVNNKGPNGEIGKCNDAQKDSSARSESKGFFLKNVTTKHKSSASEAAKANKGVKSKPNTRYAKVLNLTLDVGCSCMPSPTADVAEIRAIGEGLKNCESKTDLKHKTDEAEVLHKSRSRSTVEDVYSEDSLEKYLTQPLSLPKFNKSTKFCAVKKAEPLCESTGNDCAKIDDDVSDCGCSEINHEDPNSKLEDFVIGRTPSASLDGHVTIDSAGKTNERQMDMTASDNAGPSGPSKNYVNLAQDSTSKTNDNRLDIATTSGSNIGHSFLGDLDHKVDMEKKMYVPLDSYMTTDRTGKTSAKHLNVATSDEEDGSLDGNLGRKVNVAQTIDVTSDNGEPLACSAKDASGSFFYSNFGQEVNVEEKMYDSQKWRDSDVLHAVQQIFYKERHSTSVDTDIHDEFCTQRTKKFAVEEFGCVPNCDGARPSNRHVDDNGDNTVNDFDPRLVKNGNNNFEVNENIKTVQAPTGASSSHQDNNRSVDDNYVNNDNTLNTQETEGSSGSNETYICNGSARTAKYLLDLPTWCREEKNSSGDSTDLDAQKFNSENRTSKEAAKKFDDVTVPWCRESSGDNRCDGSDLQPSKANNETTETVKYYKDVSAWCHQASASLGDGYVGFETESDTVKGSRDHEENQSQGDSSIDNDIRTNESSLLDCRGTKASIASTEGSELFRSRKSKNTAAGPVTKGTSNNCGSGNENIKQSISCSNIKNYAICFYSCDERVNDDVAKPASCKNNELKMPEKSGSCASPYLSENENVSKNFTDPSNDCGHSLDDSVHCQSYKICKELETHNMSDFFKINILPRNSPAPDVSVIHEPSHDISEVESINCKSDVWNDALSMARIELSSRKCASAVCLASSKPFHNDFFTYTELDLTKFPKCNAIQSVEDTTRAGDELTTDKILEIAGEEFVSSFRSEGDDQNRDIKEACSSTECIPIKRRKLDRTSNTVPTPAKTPSDYTASSLSSTLGQGVENSLAQNLEVIKALKRDVEQAEEEGKSNDEDNFVENCDVNLKMESGDASKIEKQFLDLIQNEYLEPNRSQHANVTAGKSIFSARLPSCLARNLSPRLLDIINQVLAEEQHPKYDHKTGDMLTISKEYCRKLLALDPHVLDLQEKIKLPQIEMKRVLRPAAVQKAAPEHLTLPPISRIPMTKDFRAKKHFEENVTLSAFPAIDPPSEKQSDYNPFLTAERQLMELLECDDFKPFFSKSPTTQHTRRPHTTTNTNIKPNQIAKAAKNNKVVKSAENARKKLNPKSGPNSKRSSVIDPPMDFQDKLHLMSDDFELIESLINQNYLDGCDLSSDLCDFNFDEISSRISKSRFLEFDANENERSAFAAKERKYSDDLSSIDPRLINENDNLSIPENLKIDDHSSNSSNDNVMPLINNLNKKNEPKPAAKGTLEKMSRSLDEPDYFANKNTNKQINCNKKSIRSTKQTGDANKSTASLTSSFGATRSHLNTDKKKNLSSLKRSVSLVDPVKPKNMKNKQDVQNYFHQQEKKSALKVERTSPERQIQNNQKSEINNVFTTPTAEELFAVDDEMYEEYKKYEEMYLREKQQKIQNEKKPEELVSSGTLTPNEGSDNVPPHIKVSGDSAYSSLNRKAPKVRARSTKLAPLERQGSQSSPVGSPTSSGSDTSPSFYKHSSVSQRMSKFCHECGNKYPINTAKFCVECGVKRLVL